MHHRHSGPPVSARLGAAVARLGWYLRIRAGRHIRRLALLLPATVAATAVLLAAPVVTGVHGPSVTVDSSSFQTSTAPSSTKPSVGSAKESSTAWPVPTSPSAAAPAPAAPEQPVAATTGAGSPAPSEEATTAPSPAGSPPAGVNPPAAAEERPQPVPSQAGSPSATSPSATSPSATSPSATSPSATSPSATSPSATPASATPAGLGAEAQVLALVNQHRATAGCAPLAGDEQLAAVARAHSADMRDQGYFAHQNLAGDDPLTRAEQAGTTARAENIARGQRDAAAVVDGWMDSAEHRANILDCSLQRLGVGMAAGAGGPWWTQLFS